MVVISVYIHGVKIIREFRWESGFLGGVPLCTNGSAGYLMQLSVKMYRTWVILGNVPQNRQKQHVEQKNAKIIGFLSKI